MEKPLTGHGPGSRAGIADRLHAGVETRAGEQTYLIFASQYGIPGLIIYLAVMAAIMAKAVALHRRGRSEAECRMLGGVMFITWGAIILDSLTTYMWGSPYISIVPWMLVGASDVLLAAPAKASPVETTTLRHKLEQVA
jgi:O-antigen ligase